MPTLRTRFQKDIVAEFLPPSRRLKHERALILCDGMPSVPAKRSLMEYFAKQNYWVFHIRYRGSWESGGTFLADSPARDISDVIDELPKGFKSVWDGTSYRINPSDITVCGVSFGGTAALLSADDKRVSRVIALSPVCDWRVESPDEPLDWMYHFVQEAFGEGYRTTKRLWNKLKSGTFFNPIAHTDTLAGARMLIFHAHDDTIAPIAPVQKFAQGTGAQLVTRKRGGHFSLRDIQRSDFEQHIKRFLKEKEDDSG